MFQIAAQNASKTVTDASLKQILSSVQIQLWRDFTPTWGVYGSLRILAANEMPHREEWLFLLMDDADISNALGYHDLTTSGQPVLKVFARVSQLDGISPSSVISHEVLEALVDPWTNGQILVQDGKGGGLLYDAEVCDPVQDQNYRINGVEVSNFITPFWYGGPAPAGAKYDFLGSLKAPLTKTTGGYYVTQSVSNVGQPQQHGRKLAGTV